MASLHRYDICVGRAMSDKKNVQRGCMEQLGCTARCACKQSYRRVRRNGAIAERMARPRGDVLAHPRTRDRTAVHTHFCLFTDLAVSLVGGDG